jgi:hypothetical protein
MPKSQADRKAEMLARNEKALAALEVKAAKASEGREEKIEKATAKVEAATKALQKAQAGLNALQSVDPALATEKQRLLDERNWIESMPVGVVAPAGDDIFTNEPVPENGPVYDPEDGDDNFGTEDDEPVASPGPLANNGY